MNQASTQSFLPIETIKNGIIVLKNGGMRALLLCSSINFGLLTPDEQDAIEWQYQNFLNSLDFNIQTLVISRKMNIQNYIKDLEGLVEKQENELLALQAEGYMKFVNSLSEMVNLMSKNFYIVVPLHPDVPKEKLLNPKSDEEFMRWKGQLDERISYVVEGIRRTGVRCVQLNDEEIKELLWQFFNPREAESGTIPVFSEDLK